MRSKIEIYRLPTEDKENSAFVIDKTDGGFEIQYPEDAEGMFEHEDYVGQHIYFTTDEENHSYPRYMIEIEGVHEGVIQLRNQPPIAGVWKTIVATTDPKLINGENNTPTSHFEDVDRCPSCGVYCNVDKDLDDKDNCNKCRNGLPQIPISFIEQYCKERVIKEAYIEYKILIIGQCNCACHRDNSVMHIMACCHPKTIQVPKTDENNKIIIQPVIKSLSIEEVHRLLWKTLDFTESGLRNIWEHGMDEWIENNKNK